MQAANALASLRICKVGGLKIGLNFHLHPYFVYASSKGSGESAHMQSWGHKSWTELSSTSLLCVSKQQKALVSLRMCKVWCHKSWSELSSTSLFCLCKQQRLWRVCAYAKFGALKVGLNFHLHPYFVYANSKDSGESAHMQS